MSVEERLAAKVERALADTERRRRDALYRAMRRGRDSRARAFDELDAGDTFRERVKAIKERCRGQQEELIERFAARARERGAQVFFAADAAAAVRYVLDLAAKHGAKSVAKSKSLTSEEIEINHPLEAAGLAVIETDLGELIIQRVREKPFHLVFPAVHKTAPEVARIFEEATGDAVPDDIDAIMKVVRRYLRPIFLQADLGMTGANVLVAESGAIVIETNEGNARLVTSIPPVHVCIAGIEKVVETVDDALVMTLAHPLSAVGQRLTTYVTFMGGRSPLGEGGDGPRETHIVLLDNGRRRMREDPAMAEALDCIRCGACMNVCPTYGVVGGHVFGHIYPGPIGIPWTAEVHGLQHAAEFARLCVSCGLCKEICPAEIDLPMLIAEVKQRMQERSPPPRADRSMMDVEKLARVGSALAPLSNAALRSSLVRAVVEKVAGVDRRRKLPAFARRTLSRRLAGRTARAGAERRVALFADLYFQHNAPELGERACELLEATGAAVVLPRQRGSGYPYIAYGDLDRAREVAQQNVAALAPLVRDGHDVVALEPTAAYALRHSYPKLLGGGAAAEIAARTFELFDYLTRHEGPAATRLQGRRLGLHVACHQKGLGDGAELRAWLERRGAEVVPVRTGTCCGMAGTYGLKVGTLGHDLAQAIGEPLFAAFKEAGVDVIVTESSVCRMHLADGTAIRVVHPLEL